MSSLVSSVNLFPETRFWRLGKKVEMNHVFGGLASILLIVAVIAILAYKLVEVFNYDTMKVTNKNLYKTNYTSIFTTSEIKSTTNVKPSMIAFQKPSTRLEYRVYLGGDSTDITLEPCTQQHFSTYSSYFIYNWFADNLCLPLNTQYKIDADTHYFVYSITCKSGQTCSNDDQFAISVISAKPNLYEKQNDPWVYSFQKLYYNYDYYNIVDVNIDYQEQQIVTDHSLFPFESKVTNASGLKAVPRSHDIKRFTGTGGYYTINIRGNSYYQVNNRSFLTVLDALSYIGGIFNALLAAFFFMKMYGESYFEMNFAAKFFRKKEAKNFGFFSFVKQGMYSVIKMMGCNPQWDKAEKRQQIKYTVEHMMDIIYFHKRIQYLERAMTVVLEPHHRKGLQLVKSRKQIADQQCTKYSFRDRLIAFFKEKYQIEKMFQDDKNNANLKTGQAGLPKKPDEKGPGNPLKNEASQSQKVLGVDQEIDLRVFSSFKELQSFEEDEEDIFLFEALAEEGGEKNPEEIRSEIKTDLKRLIEEAEGGSDIRSRQIVSLIDARIKDWLMKQIHKDENEYRFKFKMSDDE